MVFFGWLLAAGSSIPNNLLNEESFVNMGTMSVPSSTLGPTFNWLEMIIRGALDEWVRVGMTVYRETG